MFDFNKPQNAVERMELLESFIKFWMGDEWQDDFGIPEEELDQYKLPYPLKKLYSFAGYLPPANPDHLVDTDSAFSIQDHLDAVEDLEYTDDGEVIFLWENSGNWQCKTLTEGEDPPVWVDNADQSYEEFPEGEWVQVSDSLSKLLITYCLQELVFGAKLCIFDKNAKQFFSKNKDSFTNIWKDGVYVYKDSKVNFYLMNESILVSDAFKGTFAANKGDDISALDQIQGEIAQISINLQKWSLSIEYNGSGEVSLPNKTKGKFPAGTFDFFQVEELVQNICSKEGSRHEGGDIIFFSRQGSNVTQGIYIPRKPEADQIVLKALENINEKDADFDRLLFENPILEGKSRTNWFIETLRKIIG